MFFSRMLITGFILQASTRTTIIRYYIPLSVKLLFFSFVITKIIFCSRVIPVVPKNYRCFYVKFDISILRHNCITIYYYQCLKNIQKMLKKNDYHYFLFLRIKLTI